jgi:hypothetical protein
LLGTSRCQFSPQGDPAIDAQAFSGPAHVSERIVFSHKYHHRKQPGSVDSFAVFNVDIIIEEIIDNLARAAL